MTHRSQVANVPTKPVMLYDGDCHFCGLWIRRWRQCTGDAVDYVPFQEERVATTYPELSRDHLEAAVHFVDSDGVVYDGAEAVFRSLATRHSRRWALQLYQRFPFVARAAEGCYRFVAANRSFFSVATRVCWGRHVERADSFLVRWLFLRALAVIYFVAFVSLWVQILGLVGHDGILPASDSMAQAHAAIESRNIGVDRYRLLPTFCWFSTSDPFLQFQCAAGAVLALLLMGGVAQPLCLTLLWALYLSLVTVCREFLGFQWDNLLLETGLLAIFFAPAQLLPTFSKETPPSTTVLWLLRLLLFKLMFLSGVVKLASGDATWHRLTALTYHYETQPLPTWLAWHAHQLPLWFQKGSCVILFAIELGVPFLIFMPRRLRMTGGVALGALQFLIILTGNYTFFNWLTLVLCLLLLDDFTVARLFPRRLTRHLQPVTRSAPPRKRPSGWRIGVITPLAIVIVSVSLIQLVSAFGALPGWASPVVSVYGWLSPFRSINSYGLFAVMTKDRPEIIVEGSQDRREWRAYEFRYKPGRLDRRPGFVAPHQPRLDWQMWFAALGDVRQNPWFVSFCIRLLQGSPDVLGLLKTNPFPERPPKYIRARLYDYHFTTYAERKNTGAWWRRELRGDYLPPISLAMLQPAPGAGSEPTEEPARLVLISNF